MQLVRIVGRHIRVNALGFICYTAAPLVATGRQPRHNVLNKATDLSVDLHHKRAKHTPTDSNISPQDRLYESLHSRLLYTHHKAQLS
jgi:hypothetical protein